MIEFAAADGIALLGALTHRDRWSAERAAATRARTREELFAFSGAYFGVGPVQRPTEIFSLLELAERSQVRRVCEIGAHDAGTSVLLSRGIPGVQHLIVMDLFVKNRWRLSQAAPPNQRVTTIDGNSQHPRTRARLDRVLKGEKLDLLLIDGDHRFAGVRKDFLTYRDLVADGGLIAFHDIRPARPDTGAWVGGVPDLWQLVKREYPAHEFIDTPDQSGFGIGVITYRSDVSVTPIETAADQSTPT